MALRRNRRWPGAWLLLLPVLSWLPAASAGGAVWEKYLLVIPPLAEDPADPRQAWFGQAVRTVFDQASTSLDTLVYLKSDELRALTQTYALPGNAPPEPGKLEQLADDKEIAVFHGRYVWGGREANLVCHVIPGRNEEARRQSVPFPDSRLRPGCGRLVLETARLLNLTVPDRARRELEALPGTDSAAALQAFSRAWERLAEADESAAAARAALPELKSALQADPDYPSALGLQAEVLLMLLPEMDEKARAEAAGRVRTDVTRALEREPSNRWVQNAHLAWLLFRGEFRQAVEAGERYRRLYPMNYRNALLLGRAYRRARQVDQAEAILLKALDEQGTPLQKKPFQRELGTLLLKHKDDYAEAYLKEVLLLEPRNLELMFLRAMALYRLRRYFDTLELIQTMETMRTWAGLRLLKARTTLALGADFLNRGDPDRAYTFLTLAGKLRPRHFETSLLMARVLREKGYHAEARRQLEQAQRLSNPKRSKDHLLLGKEYLAQGYKEEGAEEFVTYLKLNPKSPDRRRLISLIRTLRGEAGGD